MASEKSKSQITTTSTSITSDPKHEQDTEQGVDSPHKWKPSKQIKFIVAVQAFVCFVVALDSTILSTTLPVSHLSVTIAHRAGMTDNKQDVGECVTHKHHPNVLDSDIVSLDPGDLSATHRSSVRCLWSSSYLPPSNLALHHRLYNLLSLTRYNQHACRKIHQGYWWRWHHVHQPDNPQRHHTSPSTSPIPGISTTRVCSRHQHCTCDWRTHR
jgi:hypothetical protein